jgi:hypothetical protein
MSAYLRELETERASRIAEGRLWLAEPGGAQPAVLYQVVPTSTGGFAVVDASGAALPGGLDLAGSIVVTSSQLDRFRARVPPPGEEAAPASAGFLSSHIFLPGFESYGVTPFSRSVSPTGYADWRGALAETAFMRSRARGITMIDLETRPWLSRSGVSRVGNYPVFDFRDWLTGELFSVKSSIQSGTSGRYGYYRSGVLDMRGVTDPVTLDTAARNLFPNRPIADARAELMRRGVIVVNAEDPAFGNFLGRRAAARPGDYTSLVGGSPANLPDVKGNVVSAQDLMRLEAARRAYAAQGLTAEQVASLTSPEELMAIRGGGGGRGTALAAGRSGARGAGGGAIIAVVFQTGVMWVDSEAHPNWEEELGITAAAGLGAGGIGAAVDTALMPRMMSWFAGAGLEGRTLASAARGSSGGLAGGVAAPAFTWIAMGLSEEDYTATDYAAKGARAASGGFWGGLLGAGITGAIWGSEVPIVGNIIGFVAGVGGYLLADTVMGDFVEDTVYGFSEGFELMADPQRFVETSVLMFGTPEERREYYETEEFLTGEPSPWEDF